MMARDAAREALLDALLDKEAITDVLLRYPRALDRCDEALLRSMFHDDAVEQHGGLHTGPASDFCTLAIAMMRRLGPTAHYIANIVIALDGDTAAVESYGIAYHRVPGAAPFDSFSGARLLDRFERRSGQWRIARRRVVYDWNRDVPPADTWGRGTFGEGPVTMSRKGPDDPL